MSKKMGMWDGVIVGSGFFLGYFITRWLVTILIFTVIIWGTCYLISSNDTTRKLIPNAPSVVFRSECALRDKPSDQGKFLGSIVAAKEYRVINQKRHWRKVIVSGFNNTGWTKCQPVESLTEN